MTFICTCAGMSNCVLTTNNECSGTCANQQPCTRVVTRDESGQEKAGCTCAVISQAGGTPAGVAAQPTGILESIVSFFGRLFGGK